MPMSEAAQSAVCIHKERDYGLLVVTTGTGSPSRAASTRIVLGSSALVGAALTVAAAATRRTCCRRPPLPGSGCRRVRLKAVGSDTARAQDAAGPVFRGLEGWARGELNHLTTPVNTGLQAADAADTAIRGVSRGTSRASDAIGWDMSHPAW